MTTKAEGAKAIFAEVCAEHTIDGVVDFSQVRKIVIGRYVKELQMTPAGAATYYANNKNRGGATGSYVKQDRTNHVPTPRGTETDKADDRPLFSAVQLDKDDAVARVSAFMDPEAAQLHAAKVRGLAVIGAPEIGDAKETLDIMLSE